MVQQLWMSGIVLLELGWFDSIMYGSSITVIDLVDLLELNFRSPLVILQN